MEITARKRNWPDKVEPSRVVVFPDSAVRGTDTTNMQIKEFHPKGGRGKWLAVHIPDRMPYPRRNVKVIASRKAVKDLHRVVGPNKASLALEIQSLLGVNEDTLNQMIRQGENENERNNDEDNDEDYEKDGEAEENDNDDDDDDDIEDPFDDEDTSADCDNTHNADLKTDRKNVTAKMCRGKNNVGRNTTDGSGLEHQLNEDLGIKDDHKLNVEQPEGFELRWQEILNNFKNFDAKRKKKICRLFRIQNDVCQRLRQKRKHYFRRRLKHYLLRMLRKFLNKNKSDFEDYLSGK